MKKNSVSLLIPCYKCGDFVSSVLDSALEQTDPFDEIICYVDGCPENSLEILKQYQKTSFPNLKIYSCTDNKGLTFARNRLRELSTSNFLSYQDSDDPLHPKFVERMRPHLRKGHVTLSLFEQVEISGKKIIQGHEFTEGDSSITYLIENFHQLNSVVFCKAKLDNINGSLETISQYEDKEVLLRFVLNGGGMIIINEVLAYWIKRQSSLMHSTSWEKHNLHLLRMAENLEDLFRQQPQEVQDIWARYIEQKLQMTYFKSRCTKHFDKLIKFAAEPEKRHYRMLSRLIGYTNFLRVLYFYNRLKPTT